MPTSGDFTVLSYNVAGLPQEISTVNPQEHIPLISPLLNDYDVVLTQEDFDWWVPALDTLKCPPRSWQVASMYRVGIALATLAKRSCADTASGPAAARTVKARKPVFFIATPRCPAWS